MKKRLLLLTLSLVVATSMLAGCGQGADGGSGSSGKEEEQTEAGASGDAQESSASPEEDASGASISEAEDTSETEDTSGEEKQEITWLGYYTSNITVTENSWAEQLLEDTFNVEINPITDVTAENIEMYVASGDIADVTCFSYWFNLDKNYLYDQGMIREIPEEWLWEYYPTGMKIYSEWLGEDFFQNGGHLIDGKCLYTPYVEGKTISTACLVYRKDWMERLNMTEPTTLDELHDLLYAFTYNDPDGNGKDDTYGIDVIYNWRGMWPIFGAFGISTPNQYNVREDGTVYLNGALEDYRTALGILKEWYDEGIIHPECITDDRAAVRTKWANGTVGTMVDSQTWFYSFRGASSILAMAEDVFGEGTVDVMSALTSEYGDGTIYSNCNYPNAAGVASLLFGANATDEQVIAVLKMLEGMATDHELLTKMLYGEEGVDYTMVDGQLCVNPELTVADKAEKGIDFTFYAVGATDPYMETLTFSQRDKENIDKSNSWPTLPMTNFDCPVNAARDQYQSEVSKVVSEYYTNVLLGADNLEDGWDRYLQNLDNAGLGKIIAEYEERMK
nr:DUF3502 domain-containing protein [uncultured Acetatifactor sp.]